MTLSRQSFAKSRSLPETYPLLAASMSMFPRLFTICISSKVKPTHTLLRSDSFTQSWAALLHMLDETFHHIIQSEQCFRRAIRLYMNSNYVFIVFRHKTPLCLSRSSLNSASTLAPLGWLRACEAVAKRQPNGARNEQRAGRLEKPVISRAKYLLVNRIPRCAPIRVE